MEGAGPKILGTGAKFKRVPCQKNCRVNQAFKALEKGMINTAPITVTKIAAVYETVTF